MGRKADQFKAAQEIKQSKAKQKPVAKRRPGPGSARPQVPNQTAHNTSARGKRGGYELELSATARPPRKQTRKSGQRVKTDSPLKLTQMTRMARPSARTARRGSTAR